MVDEILLDSDGRIEYYTEPDYQVDHDQADQEQLQENQVQADQDQLQENQVQADQDQLQEDQVQINQYVELLKSIDSKLGDMENDNIRDTKTFQDAVVSSGNNIITYNDSTIVR